jgi:cytochrome P450
MLAYLLHDPALYGSIRAEVDNAISHGLSELPTRLENCKKLLAVYHELLRLMTASASLRAVDAPTNLGDVTLSPGAWVLIPYRQLHFDENVFGSNVTQFNAKRFLDNSLNKSSSFHPFGGGTTYCSGRYIAQREVLTFSALAISRYDIELAAQGPDENHIPFPRCDTTMASLGVLPPIPGDDVFVVVRKRAQL